MARLVLGDPSSASNGYYFDDPASIGVSAPPKPLGITIDLNNYVKNFDGSHDFNYPLGDKPSSSAMTSLGSGRYRITGSGFGAKPNGEKSFSVWDADSGINGFDSSVSRINAWDNTPNGSVSTAQVASGATQSVRHDLSTNAASLGFMTLTTTPLNFLMYRHRYDDFDVSTDHVRRTRVDGYTGTLPTQGVTVTGATTGTTGVIQSVDDSGGGVATFYYEPTGGSINNNPQEKFEDNETINWSGGSALVNEGQDTLTTFNNKLFRCWSKRGASGQHNTYFSESGDGIGASTNGRAFSAVEGVGGAPSLASSETGNRQQDTANTWINDLFLVQNSSSDVAEDGITAWWKEDSKYFEDTTNRKLQDVSPADGRLTELVQHQVSNGCQPNSFAYYSFIVFEDSWHFVTAWNADRSKFMLLPVESWSDTEIIVKDFSRVTWTQADIHTGSLTSSFTVDKP